MSKDHRESFKLRLQLEEINAEKYERSGQLICVTAEETLAKFMRDDLLDEDLFRSTVGSLIEKVRASVTNGDLGKVRIFGEMVSQLRGTDLKATTASRNCGTK